MRCISNFYSFRLRIICHPQYNKIDGSIEGMNFKLVPITREKAKELAQIYVKEAGKDKQGQLEHPDDYLVRELTSNEERKYHRKDEATDYYRAMKTNGHFRFESVDGVQITTIDESGATESPFCKDGTPRDFSISDADKVTFEMKGFFPRDLEVTLVFTILHFSEELI